VAEWVRHPAAGLFNALHRPLAGLLIGLRLSGAAVIVHIRGDAQDGER
jgi:hypothetical protein